MAKCVHPNIVITIKNKSFLYMLGSGMDSANMK